jgi:O-methyltransferase involved in polyketide biosynthesis
MPADDNKNIKIPLKGVQETLLLPLWARAKENEKKKPYLLDPKASEIMLRIDYDFRRLEKALTQGAFGKDHTAIFMIRNKYFDDAINKFLVGHPGATVVNIGAGLDTTFYRVDNGSLSWYDLDLPDVIDLRRKILPETNRSKCIARSVLDFSWFDDIGPVQDGLFLFAGGSLFYLKEQDVKRLFSALAARYSGAELIFDSINLMGKWGTNRANREAGMVDAPAKWAIRGAKQIARWGNHVEVVDEWPFFSRAVRDPSWEKGTILLMNMSDWLKIASIIHLRFK